MTNRSTNTDVEVSKSWERCTLLANPIASLKKLTGDRAIHLEVDGGVGPATAGIVAGTDVLAAGSAVYKGDAAEYGYILDTNN